MWGPSLARGAGSGPPCYTCDLCAYCLLLLYFSINREIKAGDGMAPIWFPTFVGPTGGTRVGPTSVSFQFPCLSHLVPFLNRCFFFFLCLYGQLGRGSLFGVGPPHLHHTFIDLMIFFSKINHNHILIVGLVVVELGKFDIACDLCAHLIVNECD